MKKAVIVGSSGQDGTLLYDLLETKNYQLIGINREDIKTNTYWDKKIDISNEGEVFNLIKSFLPDEIYYLAAHHHSSEDERNDNISLFKKSFAVNTFSLIYFLEGINQFSKNTRIFYAASSHIFNSSDSKIQNEETRINPINIYGLTKSYGLLACRYYRNNYNLNASVGILYNHDSPLRKSQFLTKKVTSQAREIKEKKIDKLVLGDLSSEIDWGYANDYVVAMHKILELDKSDEFIIATGKTRSVKDFVTEVFNNLGLDWEKYVEIDSNIVKRKQHVLIGDSSKLKKETGWTPSVSFEEMVKLLVDGE